MSMTPTALLLLFAGFQAKHFAADYLLQSAGMVRWKGTYGNPVGASHSVVHGALTLVVLLALAPLSPALAIAVALGEIVVHYHTDWTKEWAVKRLGYTMRQKGYWALFGLDQFLHQMTYVAILLLVIALA